MWASCKSPSVTYIYICMYMLVWFYLLGTRMQAHCQIIVPFFCSFLNSVILCFLPCPTAALHMLLPGTPYCRWEPKFEREGERVRVAKKFPVRSFFSNFFYCAMCSVFLSAADQRNGMHVSEERLLNYDLNWNINNLQLCLKRKRIVLKGNF